MGERSSEPVHDDEDRSRPRHRIVRALIRRPSIGGLVVGSTAWLLSLLPSMLPRSALMQAVVGAICAGSGYAVGTLLGSVAHRLLRRFDRSPTEATAARVRRAAPVAVALVVVGGVVLWLPLQNAQRDTYGVEHVSVVTALVMVLLTVVLLAVLVVLGRLVSHGTKVLDTAIARRVRPAIAHGIAAVVVVLLGVVLAQDVVARRFVDWADTSFGAADDGTPPGVVQPTSALVSGGPGSGAAWDTLGYEGRSFVANGTPVDDLRSFWGPDAEVREPIRVYAGIDTATDLDARARVVVDELERTGAFEREVLVVVTVTGTGWVDPDAATTLEYLHGGDTAIAAMQYSFLPSWISFLVDKDKAADGGRALEQAVHRRWEQLDPASRPKLLLFGLSLGSFGIESALAGPDASTSLATLRARADGVLIAGPTYDNSVWQQLTAAREPGSPVWQPVVGGGREVRFAISGAAVPVDPAWTAPRVLFVHHPDDPVGAWSWSMLWRSPAWMEEPRGALLPQRVPWIPFVSWVQGVADLSAGFSTQPGQGHNYAPDYAGAWAAVAPNPAWTADHGARLDSLIAARGS